MESYDATTTTDEVLAGVDLHGRRFVVTGASTGLGEETARAVAARGAAVSLAVRDPERGEAAAARIRETVPGAELEVAQLELDSLAGVRAFAAGFLDRHDHLDVLVNNAGIMACPYGTTVDGNELQFGTNHLGHFLLTRLLEPALLATPGSRVVALSSSGHRFADVDLQDPGFERTPYDPWIAYGRSKTANALFAVELDRRLKDAGVRAFSVHPGRIMTALGRHLTEETLAALTDAMPPGVDIGWKTVPQGAATSVWAATEPGLEAFGGRYLEDCSVAEPTSDPASLLGVRAYAQDPQRARALWERSEELVASA